jgi:hypothetical protein
LNKNFILRFTKLKLNATYSKEDIKQKERAVDDSVEDVIIDEKDSTDCWCFFNIRRNCQKTEAFVAKIKIDHWCCRAVAMVTIGYLVYQKFIAEPKQLEAADEMFVAQQNFNNKLQMVLRSDSLYKLSLNGSEGKFGFIKMVFRY